MLSWAELQTYSGSRMEKALPRTDATVRRYRRHLAKTSSDGDPGWILHHQLFGDNWAPAVLTRNDFPYDVEPDVEHYVVWFRSPKHPPINWGGLLPPGSKYVHFENCTKNRSIKAISHHHLFVKGGQPLIPKSASSRLIGPQHLLPFCGAW